MDRLAIIHSAAKAGYIDPAERLDLVQELATPDSDIAAILKNWHLAWVERRRELVDLDPPTDEISAADRAEWLDGLGEYLRDQDEDRRAA